MRRLCGCWLAGILLAGAAGLDSSRAQEPASTPFTVKPYLVYPADKLMYPEYEPAVRQHLTELQHWYFDKVGATFEMAHLVVVRSQFSYLTMRCGDPPTSACVSDPKRRDGAWWIWMNRSIHNGADKREPHTIALVFGAGGGGYAGGDVQGDFAGLAAVADWVLEPLSGKPNEWGIPCRYSIGWECAGNVPRGTAAHELGHAFGLPHPDEKLYPGKTIMRWHGDFPDAGFLPHEVKILQRSPFFIVRQRP